MKYNTKYPNIRPIPAGYQEPYKDNSLLVEADLRYTDRWSICFVCNERTQFSDETNQHYIFICSEECRAISFEWAKEFPDPKTEDFPNRLDPVTFPTCPTCSSRHWAAPLWTAGIACSDAFHNTPLELVFYASPQVRLSPEERVELEKQDYED